MQDRLLVVHSTHCGRAPSHRTFFWRHGVHVLQRVPPGEAREMRESRPGRRETLGFVIVKRRDGRGVAQAKCKCGRAVVLVVLVVRRSERCRDARPWC